MRKRFEVVLYLTFMVFVVLVDPLEEPPVKNLWPCLTKSKNYPTQLAIHEKRQPGPGIQELTTPIFRGGGEITNTFTKDNLKFES